MCCRIGRRIPTINPRHLQGDVHRGKVNITAQKHHPADIPQSQQQSGQWSQPTWHTPSRNQVIAIRHEKARIETLHLAPPDGVHDSESLVVTQSQREKPLRYSCFGVHVLTLALKCRHQHGSSGAPVAPEALGDCSGQDVRCNTHQIRTADHAKPFPTPMTNGFRLAPKTQTCGSKFVQVEKDQQRRETKTDTTCSSSVQSILVQSTSIGEVALAVGHALARAVATLSSNDETSEDFWSQSG